MKRLESVSLPQSAAPEHRGACEENPGECGGSKLLQKRQLEEFHPQGIIKLKMYSKVTGSLDHMGKRLFLLRIRMTFKDKKDAQYLKNSQKNVIIIVIQLSPRLPISTKCFSLA